MIQEFLRDMFRMDQSKLLRGLGLLMFWIVLLMGSSCSGDKNEGTERSVERRSVERRSGERKLVERRSGERRSGERKSGERKSGERKSEGKKPVARAPQKIYVWARTDARNGKLGATRALVDGFCTGEGSTTARGRPNIITPANYVTKTLVLSHDFNTFADLGAQAVIDGANEDSLAKDEVHGLSRAGANTKLSDNYGKFMTVEWDLSLTEANVGDIRRNNKFYWIGLYGAMSPTKHANNYHCQNFNSDVEGDAMDSISFPDQGSYIIGGTSARDVCGVDVSPLVMEFGRIGCDRELYYLCISFPRN